MNKKVLLVTGGLGYIGSHAIVEFEKEGYTTVIIDNLSNSNMNILENIHKILGYTPDYFNIDLKHINDLEVIFNQYQFDGVLHFASLKSVGDSCNNSLLYFNNNLGGSLNLFTLMGKYNVHNIIFSSSATVYNIDNVIPYNECQDIGKTSNVYSNIKYLTEKVLMDLSKFNLFNMISLRYFNPIGVHFSGIIGENPTGKPNNIFPFLMNVINGKYDKVKIYGGDYNTIDGTGVRDYIDINDLINGHLLAYKHLDTHKNNSGFYDVYNLGKGSGTSVLELISEIEKEAGISIKYEIINRREGDIGEFYCDAKKAQEELGWQTQVTLSQSIKNSLEFYYKNN